jgi:hypothetical protein
VIKLTNQLLALRESELSFWTLPLGLIFYIVYYLGLIMLTSKLSAGGKPGACLIPGAIHLSGGLAFAVINLGFEALDSWFIASWIVSLGLALLWLTIDWRLAKRAHESG